MTINQNLRADDLGGETQFVIVDDCITDYGRERWHAMLTSMALGYTKIAATGGWRGKEEPITIYRVASLNHHQMMACVKFLLDARWSPAIGRLMRDVYVVRHGHARGYSYEYDAAEINLPTFHGVVRRETRESATDRIYRELTGRRFTHNWNYGTYGTSDALRYSRQREVEREMLANERDANPRDFAGSRPHGLHGTRNTGWSR